MKIINIDKYTKLYKHSIEAVLIQQIFSAILLIGSLPIFYFGVNTGFKFIGNAGFGWGSVSFFLFMLILIFVILVIYLLFIAFYISYSTITMFCWSMGNSVLAAGSLFIIGYCIVKIGLVMGSFILPELSAALEFQQILLLVMGILFGSIAFVLFASAARGTFSMLGISCEDKSIIIGNTSWFAPIWRLLQIPQIVQFTGWKRWPISLTFSASTVFQSLTIVYLLFACFFLLGMGMPEVAGNTLEGPYSAMELGGITAVVFGFVAIAVWYFSVFLKSIARKASRNSAAKMLVKDSRNPIIFLRSFQNDQVLLPSPRMNIVSRFLNLGRFAASIDHLLIEEGTPYGPVIALGKPDEQSSPFGASRHYSEHEDWQATLLSFTRQASGIIVVLGQSPGLAWELDLVCRNPELLRKTLFLKDPALETEANDLDWDALPAFVQCLRSREHIGAFSSFKGEQVVMTSSELSNFAYLCGLRYFLHMKEVSSVW